MPADQARSISFTVYGKPEPKGSTKSIPFRDRSTGRLRVNTMSSNPNLKHWEVVRFEALTAVRHAKLEAPVFTGAVSVALRFGITSPKRIPKSRGPHPIVKPDLDKLMRGALDGLSGVIYIDDAQIVRFIEPVKFYVPRGARPFAEITVMEHAS